MKRLLSGLLWGALLLSAAALEVPALTGRVVDKGGVFGAEGAARVEAAIRRLETATGGGQMAVLTVPSLDGGSIEEYGIKVMDAWKIGRKDKDDGAILIISVKDRKTRLEVGYGWEGQVNDARAGDVLRGMAPFFRENRYADGAVYAVGEMQRFITGKAPEGAPEPPRAAPPEEENGWSGVGLLILILFFLFVFRGGGFVFIGGGGGRGGRGGGFGGGGFSGGGGRGGGGGASGGW